MVLCKLCFESKMTLKYKWEGMYVCLSVRESYRSGVSTGQ